MDTTVKNKVGRPSREELVENKRPSRLSINEARNFLTVKNKDPGRVYRWVNDIEDGNRVHFMTLRGYRIEMDNNLKVGDEKVSDASMIGSPVKKHVGNGKYAYLMSIERSLWEEDDKAKQKLVTEREAGLKHQRDFSEFGEVKIG